MLDLVSVIVPCYNSVAFLAETIASVKQQSWANIELVLVDDGSTDATAALIADCQANCESLQVRALGQKNQGVAAARNAGIALASGDFIVLLDADDLLHADFTTRAMRQIASADIVYPDRAEFGLFERICVAGEFSLARLKYFNQLNYCALFRRELWTRHRYANNVNGFDDWDFWIAAAKHGARARHLNLPMLQHRRHSASQIVGLRGQYSKLYARIVLNHADVYSKAEIARATSVLQGNGDYALEAWVFERGYFGPT